MKIKIPEVLKFLIFFLIILFGIGILLKTSTVYAQWDDWQTYIPAELRTNTLEGYIRTIINAALVMAGVVAVVYLIIGGYQYITSAGNPEVATQAKSTILNAVIGLIIIFASYVIIDFVMNRVIRNRGTTTTAPTPTPTTPTPTPTTPTTPPSAPSNGGVEV